MIYDRNGNEKLLITADEASEVLSLSIPTVRRRMADGTIPTIRIAGNIRIPVKELIKYIDSNTK